MSYIDEKVTYLVDTLGDSVSSALERNGIDSYADTVRKAVEKHREDIAEIIRDSFRNGLQAGRKRSSQKAAKPKR